MSQESRIVTFKDLIAWQKAIELCTLIYKVTESYPEKENFGLTSQLRRATVSIPSNLAEGFGRQTSPERLRFYEYSRGSTNEVETQLIISLNVGYINNEEFETIMHLLNEVHALVRGLINKTRKV